MAFQLSRSRSIAAWILLPLSLATQHEAMAWGATGHRLISRLAIENLADELPAFLRTPEVAELVGELSREPDRSKGTGNSHDHDLDPGHFINLSDDFAVAGVLPLNALPPTREDYDNALRTAVIATGNASSNAGGNEFTAGFLPYSIVDGWQQLQKDFGYWRADVAGERLAASTADREWFKKDRRLHELTILRDLGYWSHFVADASQPQHVSLHYDTWGPYPNPRGYSAAKGFHAAFEGAYVAEHIHADDISRKLKPPRPWDSTIQVRTLAYLRETHSRVLPLFDLEKAGGVATDSAAGRDFTAERLAAAVSELRDLILAAWRTSIDGTVGYPAVSVRDVESGKVNPLRNLQGLD
jgi:hypothetical protein